MTSLEHDEAERSLRDTGDEILSDLGERRRRDVLDYPLAVDESLRETVSRLVSWLRHLSGLECVGLLAIASGVVTVVVLVLPALTADPRYLDRVRPYATGTGPVVARCYEPAGYDDWETCQRDITTRTRVEDLEAERWWIKVDDGEYGSEDDDGDEWVPVDERTFHEHPAGSEWWGW